MLEATAGQHVQPSWGVREEEWMERQEGGVDGGKKKVVASISECFNNVKHDELKEILDLLLNSFDILRQESSKLPE